MKKLTIRIDDYIYDRLNLVSKEEKISVNKIVGEILKKEIDKPKEINILEQFVNLLNNIEDKLIKVSTYYNIIYILYIYLHIKRY